MKISIVFSLLISWIFETFAQSEKPNPYQLNLVNEINQYKISINQDSSNQLIDLEKFIPSLKLDIKYSTNDNFLKEAVYKQAKAYLRLPAAYALKKIQEDLKKKNLALKVFDGYRPYAVTLYFYEKIHDTVFVAAPWRGSKHNRGCAVDLTLIDLKNGNELQMPTKYDEMSPLADVNYTKLPKEVLKNRKILIKAMAKHGFVVYEPEWWHYDFKDWKKYALTDLNFEELEDFEKK